MNEEGIEEQNNCRKPWKYMNLSVEKRSDTIHSHQE